MLVHRVELNQARYRIFVLIVTTLLLKGRQPLREALNEVGLGRLHRIRLPAEATTTHIVREAADTPTAF